MRIFIAVSVALSLFMAACSSLPMSFSTENTMKVHRGMSSSEILELFGNPKNVSQSTCGASVGVPWSCTIWEYGLYPYERASFTFSGNAPDSLILNDFSVTR